jgi:hypothetical protein
MEDPVALTLSEAISLGLKANFESRVEYEHVMQARHAARGAYLNLVPHLNLANLLTNFPLSVYSSIAIIGDVVPFLLPNRWFMAKEAGQLFQAEKYAQIIMQADLATQIEGLGYALQRDEDILDFTRYLKSRVNDVRNGVYALELKKEFPEGSARHLEAYENSIEMDVYTLGQMISADKQALAQALGLHNPEGIVDLVFDPEPTPIEYAVKLDKISLGQVSLNRSFELQQMDALILYNTYKKQELYFSFLDPTVDPTIELGLALGEFIKIGNSQNKELQIKREKLQAVAVQKVHSAVDQYNGALDTLAMATEGLKIQEDRIKMILTQVTPNSNLNTLDILSIFQDYTVNWLRQKTIVVGFKIARANLDRLLLQGYYKDLFKTYYNEPRSAVSIKYPYPAR